VSAPPSRRAVLLAALAAIAVLAAGCTRAADAHGRTRVIDGAGATLPFPLYARWSSELALLDASVRINYQPLGSGAGIRQIADGVVDFGASDEAMSDEQLRRVPRQLLHVPMTIGAVAIAYNLPGVRDLRLRSDLLADVFRGVIVRWDDPRLRELNPELPAAPITVVHRADGSGTTAAFTTYLSRTNAGFRAAVGAGVAPRFPTGVGARGNDGVAAHVKAAPFTIGYVELGHAQLARLPVARLQNRAGETVAPTVASLEAAARGAIARVPDDLRLSIVDTAEPGAYPIAALSFVIVPREATDAAARAALVRFLRWGLHEGQTLAPALGYAPLPPELVVRAESAVQELEAAGAVDRARGGG
jgi:phosphate transport system substrate-binding protein